MRVSNKIGAVAFVAALTGLPGAMDAAAQAEQTIQSAHQFLIQMLPDGVSTVDVRVDLQVGNLYAGDATITNIASSRCQTVIYATEKKGNKGQIQRTIDWSKISEVYTDPRVIILGPIRTLDGSTLAATTIDTASISTSQRISKAMNFLRVKCDSTGNTGF